MNCNNLHAWLDSERLDTPPPAILAHLAQCAACRQAWVRTSAALTAMRALPEPPVPPGLAERMLAFARPATGRRHRPINRYWGLALAAAVVFGIGIGLALDWTVGAHAGYQLRDGVVTVPADSMTTVRIALDSARPIDNVEFVIHVPEGIELQGHPGKREVAWSGALAQGRNVLNLKLLTQPGASGILETELRYDNKSNLFSTRIVAAGPWWRAWMTGLLSRLSFG